MSRYVADSIEAQSKEKVSAASAAVEKAEKAEDSEDKIEETVENVEESDEMEVERTVLECELFFDEKPLYWMFFELILNRCNDIVISIRSEAIHVAQAARFHCSRWDCSSIFWTKIPIHRFEVFSTNPHAGEFLPF